MGGCDDVTVSYFGACASKIGSISHFEYAFEVSDSRCRFFKIFPCFNPDPWSKDMI